MSAAQPGSVTASPPPPVNRGALAAMLTAQLRGEVRFDPGTRALYATDASNYRQRPRTAARR